MASYGAVIEVSVKGQEALNKLEGSARKIESLIQGIKQQRNIFDQSVGNEKTRELKRNLESLVASFAQAKEGARQFTTTVGGKQQTINMYSKTLAGLNSQLNTFKAVANNATVGTEQYRFALQAANKVSNEFSRTQAKAAKESMNLSASNVQEALALGKTIPDSIQGLKLYLNVLEDVIQQVKIGSAGFNALEEEIANVEARLSSSRLAGQVSKIAPAAGPSSQIDTVASFNKRATYAKQVADLEYKQLVTGQQIVQAKLQQTQQDDLQNRLAQASAALQNNELDTAKRLTAEIRNQRILYERANRAEQALMRPSSMTAGAAESVTGKRPGGLPSVPGSPAAWMATGGVQAPATSNLETRVSLTKRINNITASTQMLEQKALQYKVQGLQVDKEIDHIQTLIERLKQNSLNLTKAEVDQIDLVINGLRNTLLLHKAVAATRKAEAKGTAPTPAGPAAGAAKKPGGSMLQNALIGGAFPLLFGGGPGAVAGGFAGGFIPGNPMMSIVTSAIGTVFDKIIQGARTAGESVRTLDTAISHMAEQSLFSSTEVEAYTKTLEQSGRYTLARQMVEKELNRIVGYDGVKSLTALGESSKNVNRAWAEFNLQLQAALAGPLSGLLQWLADVIKVGNDAAAMRATTKDIANRLTPAQARQFEKELIPTYGAMGRFGPAAKPEEQAKIIAKYEQLAQRRSKTDIKLSAEEMAANIKNGEELYVELNRLARDLHYKKIDYANEYSDMVLNLERQQYDLNEQLARKAQDINITTYQKELELLRKKGEIAIQIERNAIRERSATSAPGQDLAASLRKALDEYAVGIKEINNKASEQEKEIKLNLLQLDVENERYKLDNAKTINRLNYDNNVRIARINEQINRQNEELSQKNLTRKARIIEGELSVIRAQAIMMYAEAKAQIQRTDLDTAAKKYYRILSEQSQKVLAETVDTQAKIQAGALFKVPTGLSPMGALPKLTSDTQQVDAANKGLKTQIGLKTTLLNKTQKAADKESIRLKLVEDINSLGIDNLKQTKTQLDKEIETAKAYAQIINTGVLPAQAQQQAVIDTTANQLVEQLKKEEASLQLKKQTVGLNETETLQLAEIELAYGRVQEAVIAATDALKESQSERTRLVQSIASVQGELNTLVDPINQITSAADRIGTAFSESFKGVISGAMTAQEALASFFQSVADHFLDMAAQIIAKWIEMTILNNVLSLFPGGGGGGMAGLFGAGAPAAVAGGGIFSGAGPYQFKAAGGSVMGGTPYVVGEKGPELFVPGRSGTIIPNNQLGGGTSANVVVNVDASGSSVQGSGQEANQLGKAIGIAVQQELIKQKRPGGLLA